MSHNPFGDRGDRRCRADSIPPSVTFFDRLVRSGHTRAEASTEAHYHARVPSLIGKRLLVFTRRVPWALPSRRRDGLDRKVTIVEPFTFIIVETPGR
jgi:hypothetical protein